MTTLLEIREYMKSIYSRYSQVMAMAAKFFITLIAVILIGNRIGYNETVSGALVAVVVSLLSSLIPWGGICAILGLVILLNLWAVSMEVAAVGAVIFLLIFLLYFRFSPGDGVRQGHTVVVESRNENRDHGKCFLGIIRVSP